MITCSWYVKQVSGGFTSISVSSVRVVSTFVWSVRGGHIFETGPSENEKKKKEMEKFINRMNVNKTFELNSNVKKTHALMYSKKDSVSLVSFVRKHTDSLSIIMAQQNMISVNEMWAVFL